jgi:spermidine synthase
MGMLNISVALFVMVFVDYAGKKRIQLVFPAAALIILGLLVWKSNEITNVFQKRLYYDDIVFSKRTRYQEIVLTRNGGDFKLYLDGSLQFSSHDEYRYHEMLVYPALGLLKSQGARVLVLGGGDGIAVGYILRSPIVSRVTLVELDPEMLALARRNSSFRRLNRDSLNDPRVRVIAGDAYNHLIANRDKYNCIIADFPDPHDETISKLYTVEFFSLIRRSLAPDGVFVTQSTSPYYAPDAFWCINRSMKEVFWDVLPYHVYVPSFGDWGFNMASVSAIKPDDMAITASGCRYFSKETFTASKNFSADSLVKRVDINTFNKPVLYRYYIRGWKNYMEY